MLTNSITNIYGLTWRPPKVPTTEIYTTILDGYCNKNMTLVEVKNAVDVIKPKWCSVSHIRKIIGQAKAELSNRMVDAMIDGDDALAEILKQKLNKFTDKRGRVKRYIDELVEETIQDIIK
jgi:hypothetical protein